MPSPLDAELAVAEAVQIVHEANVRNRAGDPDNNCKCGHKPQAHYLPGGFGKRAGCLRCDQEKASGARNYLCNGYEWVPRTIPPLPTEDAIRPQGPNFGATVAMGMQRCQCGHLYAEHAQEDGLHHCYAQLCGCEGFILMELPEAPGDTDYTNDNPPNPSWDGWEG